MGLSWQDVFIGPKGTPMRETIDPDKIPMQESAVLNVNQYGMQQAMGQQQASRDQTQAFAGQLAGQAAGTSGPSAAQAQLNVGLLAAQNAAASQAASATGADGALARRNAAGALSNANVLAASQAVQLRAQEQQAAQQQYARVLQDQRMADLQNAGLSFQQAQAQLDAETRVKEANQNAAAGNAQTKQQGSAGIIGAAGSFIGALSDANLKDSIREDTPAYEGVRSVSYKYKPGLGLDTKRRSGIIAQELEKSPAFRDAVIETPIGKAIDVRKALSVALAEGANLHARLKKLEAKQ